MPAQPPSRTTYITGVQTGIVSGLDGAYADSDKCVTILAFAVRDGVQVLPNENLTDWVYIDKLGPNTGGPNPVVVHVWKRNTRPSNRNILVPSWKVLSGSVNADAAMHGVIVSPNPFSTNVNIAIGTRNTPASGYVLAGAAQTLNSTTIASDDEYLYHLWGMITNPGTGLTFGSWSGEVGHQNLSVNGINGINLAGSEDLSIASGSQGTRAFQTTAAMNSDWVGYTITLRDYQTTAPQSETPFAWAWSQAGTVSITGGPINITGVAAVATASNTAGTISLATVVPGDFFANPIILTGSSGSSTANVSGATAETGETWATKSIWFLYETATPGTLTIRGTDTTSSYKIEGFDGTEITDLTSVGVASYSAGGPSLPDISWRIAGFGVFSVYNNGVASTGSSVGIDYIFDASVASLELDNLTGNITQPPALASFGFLNASPGEDVEFSMNVVGVIGTLVADASGVGTGGLVIPETATAGTYTVTATGQTSGKTASVPLSVLNSAPAAPTGPAADTPPVAVEQEGVVKWVLQDPAPGGDTYIFDINPTRMMAPYAPKNVTPETTTASDGTVILWEGARRAHRWGFEGFITDQDQYDALVTFLNIQRRFYLTDHKNRTWVVTFEAFDPTPIGWKGTTHNYKYSMDAYIYAGPYTAV